MDSEILWRVAVVQIAAVAVLSIVLGLLLPALLLRKLRLADRAAGLAVVLRLGDGEGRRAGRPSRSWPGRCWPGSPAPSSSSSGCTGSASRSRSGSSPGSARGCHVRWPKSGQLQEDEAQVERRPLIPASTTNAASMTSSGTKRGAARGQREEGESGDDRQNAQGRDQTLTGTTNPEFGAFGVVAAGSGDDRPDRDDERTCNEGAAEIPGLGWGTAQMQDR